MTDAECEAQLRRQGHEELRFLLRLLDEARAELAALKAECQDEETMTELRAEIARLTKDRDEQLALAKLGG